MSDVHRRVVMIRPRVGMTAAQRGDAYNRQHQCNQRFHYDLLEKNGRVDYRGAAIEVSVLSTLALAWQPISVVAKLNSAANTMSFFMTCLLAP